MGAIADLYLRQEQERAVRNEQALEERKRELRARGLCNHTGYGWHQPKPERGCPNA